MSIRPLTSPSPSQSSSKRPRCEQMIEGAAVILPVPNKKTTNCVLLRLLLDSSATTPRELADAGLENGGQTLLKLSLFCDSLRKSVNEALDNHALQQHMSVFRQSLPNVAGEKQPWQRFRHLVKSRMCFQCGKTSIEDIQRCSCFNAGTEESDEYSGMQLCKDCLDNERGKGNSKMFCKGCSKFSCSDKDDDRCCHSKVGDNCESFMECTGCKQFACRTCFEEAWRCCEACPSRKKWHCSVCADATFRTVTICDLCGSTERECLECQQEGTSNLNRPLGNWNNLCQGGCGKRVCMKCTKTPVCDCRSRKLWMCGTCNYDCRCSSSPRFNTISDKTIQHNFVDQKN